LILMMSLQLLTLKTKERRHGNISPESVARKTLRMKVKELMVPLDTVSTKDTLLQAIDYLLDYDSVFVLDESYRGVIRREDLLFVKDLGKKVGDFPFSKEKYYVESNTTILDAFNLMKRYKLKRLCVSDKDEIKGEVSLFSIQRAIRISKHNLGSLPHLRETLEHDIIKFKKGEFVESVVKTMKERNSKIVLITEDEKVIGIFTLREYLDGLKKYHGDILKQRIESVMLSGFPKIDPEMDVFEANKIIIDKGFRHIPVISHDVVLGIMSDEKVADSLISYLREV
jgi:CBS domain-containing protein